MADRGATDRLERSRRARAMASCASVARGALIAALFALGLMSLTWMALVASLVALQKVGPWRRGAVLPTAGVLLALSVGIAIAPADVPGLDVPSGSRAMHAMEATG